MEGDDEKGILPCLDKGGTVECHFGYGSDYDCLTRDGIWQGAICDDCFGKKKKMIRRVIVHRHASFEVKEEITGESITTGG